VPLLHNPALRLSTLLWLIALHSAAVGLGLVLHPAPLLAEMGYVSVNEPFFPTQGGVFHIIMAVGYAMAAQNLERRRSLVTFTVVVKALALLFLVTYWALAARLPTILLSGLLDGAMAVAVAWAYMTWRRSRVEGIA